LIQSGIEANQIKNIALTGLLVNIKGKGDARGDRKVIALRADMDGLMMSEDNPNLEYRSQNENIAHACGHDGHMAILLQAADFFI